jgi:pimeloyl-ACP methyl ester carboxylesterase/GNAT superfamily N-acetyltransferase
MDLSFTIAGKRIEAAWHGPAPERAPTLVLLHEGLGSVAMWKEFPQQLAERTGYGVLVYSRPGYGNSDPVGLPRPLTYMHEEAREILPAVLDQASVRKAILVGHSDGASIALIYAAEHEVSAVVAIAPHVFVEDVCLREIRRARETYETSDLRERMGRHHRDPDAAFFGWNDVWLDPAFPDWSITDLLATISCPLLLIQGERDQYGTMSQLDAIEQRASGPVRRVHLDCQHSPPTELPDATTAAIASFVDELDSAIRIKEEPYDGPAAKVLVPDYVAEIRAMYPEWTPDVPPRLTPEDVEPPAGRWVVAYRRTEPIGCAALKRLDDHTAEIKRVYVAPDARGLGVARAILARLERIAQDVGYAAVRMDTGARQPASAALFSSSGYEQIADYNGNPVAAYWFEKRLA